MIPMRGACRDTQLNERTPTGPYEEFQIKLGGMVVAGASGTTARSQAMHYAQQYAQDGNVTVQIKHAGRWRNFLKISKGEVA